MLDSSIKQGVTFISIAFFLYLVIKFSGAISRFPPLSLRPEASGLRGYRLQSGLELENEPFRKLENEAQIDNRIFQHNTGII